MQLVTGYTGTKHVSAQDDSIRNVMLGEFNGKGVFPVFDENFEATAVTANEVRVSSGYGINQGRLFKIDRNDYDSCIIENGTAGYKRVDLIVARYLKNEQTGIESCELVVIKGTPNADAYVDPSYTKGTLLNGDLQDDMPMYRVKLDGVTIQPLEPLFKVYNSLIGGAEDLIDTMVNDNFNDKLAANQQAFNQMIAEDDDAFETWFAQVQAYLDEETATRLANASASHNTALGAFDNNTTDGAGNVNGLGVLPVSHGGTGASTVAGARNNLGLGNTSGALPIANGGTGADNANDAFSNLAENISDGQSIAESDKVILHKLGVGFHRKSLGSIWLSYIIDKIRYKKILNKIGDSCTLNVGNNIRLYSVLILDKTNLFTVQGAVYAFHGGDYGYVLTPLSTYTQAVPFTNFLDITYENKKVTFLMKSSDVIVEIRALDLDIL